jgi:hypothetical protein
METAASFLLFVASFTCLPAFIIALSHILLLLFIFLPELGIENKSLVVYHVFSLPTY